MLLGQKLFSCAALHQSPCLRVALRLHDLILFDGCIISMYEDPQGRKIPAWLMLPRVTVPGYTRWFPWTRRKHHRAISNRSAWLRWRPGWMAPGRTLVCETHVLPSGSAFMQPRRGPRIGDIVADMFKAFGCWKLS